MPQLKFKRSLLLSLVTGALVLLGYLPPAKAQTCGCDHTVHPSDQAVTVSGTSLKIRPGQTICLLAGFYKQVLLEDIVGEPGRPVTIKNCGGQVLIGNDTNFGERYAVDVRRSRFIRLTGSGHAATTYGIVLNKSGDSGLKVGYLSSDTEIDHLEIRHSKASGMLIKTDFHGQPPPDAPEMNRVHIHHNFVHDVGNEGMYIGETKTPGQKFRHLYVHNNIITRTGLDLLQIANAVEDVEVHHNVLVDGGQRQVLYHNKGLQIGDNTVGRYYNNIIIGDKHTNAFLVMGSGHIEIFNNYCQGTTEHGISIDNRTVTLPNAPIQIYANFLKAVDPDYVFFKINNELNPVRIRGNHLDGPNPLVRYDSGAGPGNVTLSGNTVRALPPLQFVNATADDFRLAPNSPYLGLGLLPEIGPPASRKMQKGNKPVGQGEK